MAVLYLLGEDPTAPEIDTALEPLASATQRHAVARGLADGERSERARVLASYLASLIHAIDTWSLS